MVSSYQRFAYRILGTSVDRPARSNVHLQLGLQKSHLPLRPEVYLAYSYLNMILVFVIGAVLVGTLLLLRLSGIIDLPLVYFVFLVPLPAVMASTVYALTFLVPDLRAAGRARDINAKLPYALNFMSTMASAGVTPERMFQSLSEQPIYGEVAAEAAWISRDLKILGKDLISALTAAIDRSPSIKFQDLLQGAITALTSGENVQQYFLNKGQQFVYENRQDQKRFLESLSVLAESYVTVVVAAPLFLIVLISVFLMFGSRGESMLTIGYALVLIFLPLAQLGFAVTASGMTPEA